MCADVDEGYAGTVAAGFKVQGSGFRVAPGMRSGFGVSGFRVWGFEGSGCWALCLRFGGFRAQCLAFRV